MYITYSISVLYKYNYIVSPDICICMHILYVFYIINNIIHTYIHAQFEQIYSSMFTEYLYVDVPLFADLFVPVSSDVSCMNI